MKTLALQVRPGDAGAPLVAFLALRLETSRRRAKQLLDERNVFVNGQRVWMAKHALRNGDTVEVLTGEDREKRPQRLKILYEDDLFLVVDKRPGTLAAGPDSVEQMLTEARSRQILAVHRLDRDTTGCLLLAKSRDAFEAGIDLFRGRRVRKRYHLLAVGRVSFETKTIRRAVEGQSAVTHVRRVDSAKGASHLLATIETGRTHQIRKHMTLIHHPVLGDKRYGPRSLSDERLRQVPRQMLHAFELAFPNPVSGETITVTAPLPADFRQCMKLFGLS
jgi:RluA family pseudouridine synthase